MEMNAGNIGMYKLLMDLSPQVYQLATEDWCRSVIIINEYQNSQYFSNNVLLFKFKWMDSLKQNKYGYLTRKLAGATTWCLILADTLVIGWCLFMVLVFRSALRTECFRCYRSSSAATTTLV
mmetsp:Transcript_22530/g.47309  ORF Transcript_22530/g.47309 Transcript_22530/m.47309 type:complete len:122 (-) Transcript_22530:98-463(-)